MLIPTLPPALRPAFTAVAVAAAIAAAAASCSSTASAPTLLSSVQHVASVDVSPAADTLAAVGQTRQFSAVPRDSAGAVVTGVTISWTSSDSAVANVTDSGVVNAVTSGSATITATASGIAGHATVVVAIPAPVRHVASVVVSPAADTLVAAGQTKQLTAVARDSTGAVMSGVSFSWASSNHSVATVDSAGFVSAVANGSTTITATASGVAGHATVLVAIPAGTTRVASVVVSPAADTLAAAGQTKQLTAVARDSTGAVMSGVSFSWASSNHSVATVDSAGFVSAVANGTATITATASGIAGHATVVVAIPAPVQHVASVVVSPAVDTLVAAGQTKQFTAVARDSSGVVVNGATFSWTSSDSTVARISSTGMATAVANGTATVTATASSVSGHATALVVIPASPPPGTVLFQEGFEDTQFASRGWYDNTSMTITTAESHSGTHSLQVHFTQGATVPTYGGASRHLFTPGTTVYLSYWVKYSTNWIGSGQAYHPHEFYFVTNEDDQYIGPSATHLTTYVEDNYQSAGGYPRLAMTDVSNIDQTKIGQNLVGVTEQRAAAGCNGNGDAYTTNCYAVGGGLSYNEKVWTAPQAAFLPNPGPGYKNDWHFVEAYFQLNTIKNGIGQADGVAQYWVDGQLVINSQNVLFRTGAHPTMEFNQFLLGPYIGDGSPVDQTMWIDDITVATSHP